MADRALRFACVLVVAALTTQAGIYGKKRGPGTNLGSGYGSADDLRPSGQTVLQSGER